MEYIFMIYTIYHERKDMTILLVLGNSLILNQDFVTFFYPQQTVHLFVWFHIDWLSQLHNNVLGGEDGFPTLFTVYSKIRLFTNYFISNHPPIICTSHHYYDVGKKVSTFRSSFISDKARFDKAIILKYYTAFA